jgi:hypothetical protein
MNFNQTLAPIEGAASVGAAIILLILSAAAYRRTRDWGFFCWIFAWSGALLQTVFLHSGEPIVRYYGSRSLFFVTALVFTVGASRIVYHYLQLFSASHASNPSRSPEEPEV